MGGFRFLVEPFIVFRSDVMLFRRLELTTARRAPLMTSLDTDGSKARLVREFERTLGSSCR
jgi:hypothetical protein